MIYTGIKKRYPKGEREIRGQKRRDYGGTARYYELESLKKSRVLPEPRTHRQESVVLV